MWAIMVQVTWSRTDANGRIWDGSYGLPMFYLDENVQGIMSEEGAKKVAMGIVNHMPPDDRTNVEYHITAVRP